MKVRCKFLHESSRFGDRLCEDSILAHCQQMPTVFDMVCLVGKGREIVVDKVDQGGERQRQDGNSGILISSLVNVYPFVSELILRIDWRPTFGHQDPPPQKHFVANGEE